MKDRARRLPNRSPALLRNFTKEKTGDMIGVSQKPKMLCRLDWDRGGLPAILRRSGEDAGRVDRASSSAISERETLERKYCLISLPRQLQPYEAIASGCWLPIVNSVLGHARPDARHFALLLTPWDTCRKERSTCPDNARRRKLNPISERQGYLFLTSALSNRNCKYGLAASYTQPLTPSMCPKTQLLDDSPVTCNVH